MAGFGNDISNTQIMFTDNVDFTGAAIPTATVTTDGQLLIGNTAGARRIQVGELTSPLGTITIGYNDPDITLDVAGGATGVDSFAMQTGTSPVVPNGAGLVTFNGSSVAAGTNPVRTNGTAANTMQLEVQTSVALAAEDATRIGLSNFDSGDFTVSAGGFVSLAGGGAGQTITGDSGGALSPTAGNWNVLGRSGSKTRGSGSTLTVDSPPFSQVGASATSSLNSGEFVTATATRTLPATAGLIDGDLVIYFCTTANALTITANTGQTIRIGTLVSSSGGTATSTAIGDSVTLRFDATAISWRAVSVIGTWLIA